MAVREKLYLGLTVLGALGAACMVGLLVAAAVHVLTCRGC